MTKFSVAAFLLLLVGVPAFAASHKPQHPKAVEPQNPYLKHHHKTHYHKPKK